METDSNENSEEIWQREEMTEGVWIIKSEVEMTPKMSKIDQTILE